MLTQTGPVALAGERASALAAWPARIEPLAKRLAEAADRDDRAGR